MLLYSTLAFIISIYFFFWSQREVASREYSFSLRQQCWLHSVVLTWIFLVVLLISNLHFACILLMWNSDSFRFSCQDICADKHKIAKDKFIYILKLSKASWGTPHVSEIHQTRGTTNEGDPKGQNFIAILLQSIFFCHWKFSLIQV